MKNAMKKHKVTQLTTGKCLLLEENNIFTNIEEKMFMKWTD